MTKTNVSVTPAYEEPSFGAVPGTDIGVGRKLGLHRCDSSGQGSVRKLVVGDPCYLPSPNSPSGSPAGDSGSC